MNFHGCRITRAGGLAVRLAAVLLPLSGAGYTACRSVALERGLASDYVLESIDGQPLPAPVSSDAFRTVEIVSATVRFHGDGTFSSRTVARTVQGHASRGDTLRASGRYTRSGSTLVLTNAQNGYESRMEIVRDDTLRFLSGLANTYLYRAAKPAAAPQR